MEATTATFAIDLENLTVTVDDGEPQPRDLNARGEACETLDDLRDFVRELHEAGAFDEETRDELLEAVKANREDPRYLFDIDDERAMFTAWAGPELTQQMGGWAGDASTLDDFVDAIKDEHLFGAGEPVGQLSIVDRSGKEVRRLR